MSVRLVLIFKKADRATAELPHRAFHRMVCHDLLAIYLADRKVDRRMRQMAIRIMKEGRGATLLFFPDVLAPPATQKRLIGRISATQY